MNKKRGLILSLILTLALSMIYVPSGTGVAEAAAKKITITQKKVTITQGKKKTLKVKTSPKSLKKKVKWSTSNKKVAKVSKKGVVKGIKAGKATIKAKVKSGKKTYTAKCKVTVKAKKKPTSTPQPAPKPQPTPTPQPTDLKPGAAVKKDSSSPTGYTVTFVYENAKAKKVDLSGTFAFYKEGGDKGKLPEKMYSAYEWEPGMFRASSSDLATTIAMKKKAGTNYWVADVPLPSGHYLYNYIVDDAKEGITDPGNGPMVSTAASGNKAKLSTVDVPYADVQGACLDFSFMMKNTNVPAGEVVYADYKDVNGNDAPLAIYLPNGYDKNRAEGYKVLYLSHGFGGSEMEWFSSGNTQYVVDKLIADKAIEPTIVVTMNNTNYSWKLDVIHDNVMNCIIPFMEKNYNAGKSASDRAFSGLSMGGRTTAYMYTKEAENFGYFGILSGSTWDGFTEDVSVDSLRKPAVMFGAGCYDFGLTSTGGNGPSGFAIDEMAQKLNEIGITDYGYYEVKGGHDWTVWPQLIKIFAEKYLWKQPADLKPGVTVEENSKSPTGYTATFVYRNADAGKVDLAGTFAFYKEGGDKGKLPEKMYSAYEWKPGMFRANNTDLAAKIEMRKRKGTNCWVAKVPLPSGHYLYNYIVDDAKEGITDPNNGPMVSTAASGSKAKLSTVDVPYADEQGASIDFSFMMKDENVPAGEVVYADYTDVKGNLAPLAIYLPYGYDKSRTEGYKVLYLSHGAGGSEMEWFSSGNTQYVFDKLIANQTIEPTIVVTMNNTNYSWDLPVIRENIMMHIIPFMEENYNAGKNPSDRAFSGLSMGGVTTSYMYSKEAENFGYFGILSGSTQTGLDEGDVSVDSLKKPAVMLGAGCYDFGLTGNLELTGKGSFPISGFAARLDEMGITDYGYYEVKGGHDWIVWPQLIKIFAEKYLWKVPQPGVTVREDSESPTGYTATFVYENADAKEVKLAGTFAFYKEGGDIGKLPVKMYSAYEWEPGMFRASSTDLAASIEMKKKGTYWTVDVPLPGGHYLYNYIVDGAKQGITDPANGPMKSTAQSGSTAKLSTVDVPYADVQGTSIDFTFMMKDDNAAEGQLTFADYTDVNGAQAPLAIYLPAGYDANRAEGYKVLYLSHGGGGNETEWFSSGSTHRVFDNMIAAGTVEPTIVVTMSNGVYGWDMNVIHENMMGHVIPFMEENYNVGKTPADRAFAGLSMGGMTASRMYTAEAENFGYFGIFSGSSLEGFTDDVNVDSLKKPVLMVGAGYYDMALMPGTGVANSTTADLCTKLGSLKIPYGYYNVKGGHDWTTWPQLIKIFAEQYLWK